MKTKWKYFKWRNNGVFSIFRYNYITGNKYNKLYVYSKLEHKQVIEGDIPITKLEVLELL